MSEYLATNLPLGIDTRLTRIIILTELRSMGLDQWTSVTLNYRVNLATRYKPKLTWDRVEFKFRSQGLNIANNNSANNVTTDSNCPIKFTIQFYQEIMLPCVVRHKTIQL